MNNNAFYEHAVESAPPLAEYDPVFDVPEPKRPRRRLAFKTVRGGNGWTHYLIEGTKLHTGHYTVCGEVAKYAGIGIWEGKRNATIQVYRKHAAELLRKLRKAGEC